MMLADAMPVLERAIPNTRAAIGPPETDRKMSGTATTSPKKATLSATRTRNFNVGMLEKCEVKKVPTRMRVRIMGEWATATAKRRVTNPKVLANG
jgi:hypothetical protein